MGELVNWITFIRNIIIGALFGLLVPYLIFRYLDSEGLVFNYEMMILNGSLYLAIYSFFGLFKKETALRFIMGCLYIGFIIYFYTSGYTIYTFYLPHCGFGVLCLGGEWEGVKFSLSYIYWYTAVIVVSLKGVSILRQLIKPPDEKSKIKRAARQKVGLKE